MASKRKTPNLDRLIANLEDPTPILQELGPIFVAIARDRFQSKTAPDGMPWAQWAPATARARIRSGTASKGLLVLSGALQGSCRYNVTGNKVIISMNTPYAGFHQDGTRNMPMRRLLGYGDAEKQAVAQVWTKWINK
jgi:phage virion morphogenesis protein